MYLFILFIILQGFTSSLSKEIQITDNYLINFPNGVSLEKILEKLKQPPRATVLKTNKTQDLVDYLEYIKTTGIKTFENLKDKMKEIKVNGDIDINTVTENYVNYIHQYFSYTVGPKTEIMYDEEIILVDLAEIACRLICDHQIKLIKNSELVIDDKHYSLILKYIHKDNTNFRIEQMQYICTKYSVCRPFPSFTDYIGYLVNEILKLPARKLKIFIKLLNMILSVSDDFDKVMSKVNINEIPDNKNNGKYTNATKTKEFLKILNGFITQKFYIINHTSFENKMKASAMRILLDIIDKSYKDTHFNDFVSELGSTIYAIRHWAKDKIPIISKDVVTLLTKIIKDFDHILHSNKDKLMILINITYGNKKVDEKDFRDMFLNNYKQENPVVNNFVK